MLRSKGLTPETFDKLGNGFTYQEISKLSSMWFPVRETNLSTSKFDPQSRVHDPDVAYMIGNNLYINTGTVYLWNSKAYIEAVHINSPF